jgi:hypothetical protein
MQKDRGDGLVMEGERMLNSAVKTPQDNQFNHKQDTTKTSFTYNGVRVHINYSENGKGLDELLVNYFKSQD